MSTSAAPRTRPWVIAHRGASGLLPEHTLPAYALAIEQGADVIEPDLLASRDMLLYARHDLGLARSTDIAKRPEHAQRRRPGADGTLDWWIDEFDSGELDQLRAIQPWPQRPHERDGDYAPVRWTALLDFFLMERRRRERDLLLYPEIKHPDHYAGTGSDIVAAFVSDMRRYQLLGPQAPVLVQCFELDSLLRVQAETSLRVTLLSQTLPESLDAPVAGYGLAKSALSGAAGAAFIAAAHARGRYIHAWTFRDDVPMPGLSPFDECLAAYAAGCDGLFCDFPATGRRARDAWLAQRGAM